MQNLTRTGCSLEERYSSSPGTSKVLWVSRTHWDHGDVPSVGTGALMGETLWFSRGLRSGWDLLGSAGAAAPWPQAGRANVSTRRNRAGGENAQRPLPASRVRAAARRDWPSEQQRVCVALSAAWAALLGGTMSASCLCWEPVLASSAWGCQRGPQAGQALQRLPPQAQATL